MMREPEQGGADSSMTVVTLVTGDSLYFRRYEITLALLHPRTLPFHLLGVTGMFILPAREEFLDLSVMQRVIMCAATGTIGVGLMLLVAFLVERFRPKGETVRVHASPFIAGGVLGGVLLGNALLQSFTGVRTGVAQTLVMWAFFHVYVEAFNLLIVYIAMPRIIRDLRAPDAGAPVAKAGPAVEIGGQSFDVCTLVRIEADGNYLQVLTVSGRRFVPGPFGKVVEELPPALGMRVGRSDWVASLAVAGLRSEGREMAVLLRNGDEVAVAQSRRKAVADWVRGLPSPEAQVEPDGEMVRRDGEDTGERIVLRPPQHA